jgi:hypothetical protein
MTPRFEREVQRTFHVTAGSLVTVDINGGSIHTATGLAATVRLILHERIAARSEDEAERALANFDVDVSQTDDTVVVRAKRKDRVGSWTSFDRVQFSAELDVPADVRLDLRTSGGSLRILGDRSAALRAHTSGGSVRADGGAGEMALNTSGGSITVGRVLRTLRATTSGGSIRVGYVGPGARDVELGTSGGSIQAGVDPGASLDASAGTSGGGVRIERLAFDREVRERSRFSGVMNGGQGRLVAHTSGGSILLRAAASAEDDREK